MLNILNDLIWSKVLIIMLIGLGLYFTIASRFVQFRYFANMFSIFGEAFQRHPGQISSFQALMLSVAGRVGAGSEPGVCRFLPARKTTTRAAAYPVRSFAGSGKSPPGGRSLRPSKSVVTNHSSCIQINQHTPDRIHLFQNCQLSLLSLLHVFRQRFQSFIDFFHQGIGFLPTSPVPT